jgi:protocatechuate 3,4-dioxygenase beta subunit
LSAFPPAPQINGEILLVFGHVVDASGNPISGVRVEFWQTDSNGIYDHPGDPNTQARDLAFQFYGSSAVDADGIYRFRTIVPGEYEPRPAHIHVKVKLSGTELLTTQFYLADDAENVQDEGIFRSAGEAGENLFLTTEMQTDVNGTEVLVARKDIVIDSGGGGNLTITPAQTEGPYYPRVNVSEYDNDLVIVD